MWQEQQAAFYTEVAAFSADAAKQRYLTIVAIEEQKMAWQDRGEWQPLTVWGKRGYNTATIEANTAPQDIKEHAVLGKLYRVWLESNEHSLTKSTKKEDRAEMRGTPNVKSPQLAIEDGNPGPDPSDSDSSAPSSSSSSSSSGRKHKKKHKRSKKDKRGKSSKHDKKAKKDKKKDKKDKKEKKDCNFDRA